MSTRCIKSKDISWKKNKSNNLMKNLINENGFGMDFFKLAPNEKIPMHKHPNIKYSYILKGSMSDETGEYSEGEVVVNEKDSEHSVTAGSKGCEFLVIYNENS